MAKQVKNNIHVNKQLYVTQSYIYNNIIYSKLNIFLISSPSFKINQDVTHIVKLTHAIDNIIGVRDLQTGQ